MSDENNFHDDPVIAAGVERDWSGCPLPEPGSIMALTGLAFNRESYFR